MERKRGAIRGEDEARISGKIGADIRPNIISRLRHVSGDLTRGGQVAHRKREEVAFVLRNHAKDSRGYGVSSVSRYVSRARRCIPVHSIRLTTFLNLALRSLLSSLHRITSVDFTKY